MISDLTMIDAFQKAQEARSKRAMAVKYYLPAVTILLGLILIGNIAVNFMKVSNLSKTTGKIINLRTKITSWTHHRGLGYGTNTPNYSFVISLENDTSYNVDPEQYRIRLAKILSINDTVTIYHPTVISKILSAGFIRDVNQVERNGKVLYSWREQKDGDVITLYFLAGFIIALYLLRHYLVSIDS